MKTNKEWFESVENSILRKVLLMTAYTEFLKNNYKCNYLSQAVNLLAYQFMINSVDYDFWIKVSNELINSNESLTFNSKYSVMQVEWLDENECIHCKTKEESIKICQLMHNLGLKWYDEKSYLKDTKFDFNDYNETGVYYLPKSGQWSPCIHTYITYPAKLFIKDIKQDLLEEAKRRYPNNTICKSLYNGKLFTTLIDNNRNINYEILVTTTNETTVMATKPNLSAEYLYYDSKWASYVEVFGFKIGDVIDKDVLNAWKHETKIGAKWVIHDKDWGWSPTIDKIEFIDNCICLETNNNVYIKAEGLREFIELEKLKQDVKKAKKQFIECCNDLKQNNMKQTLKLGKIKEIMGKMSRNNTKSVYYTLDWYLDVYGDNSKSYVVEIKQEHLKTIKQYSTVEELKLFTDAGLTFDHITKIMKTQTLTLGQLKDLYKEDTCPEWRSMLLNYLEQYNICKDDYKIEINQEDLDYAKSNASKAQLKLLTDTGLKFEDECSYKIGDYILFKVDSSIGKITDIVNNWIYYTKLCGFSNCFEYNNFKNHIRKATLEEIKYAQIDWDKLKTGSVVKINIFNECNLKNIEWKVVLVNADYIITQSKSFEKAANNDNVSLYNSKQGYITTKTNNITEVISY